MNIPKNILESIIEALEERFPDKLPVYSVDTETLNKLIGHQQVINFLRGEAEVAGSKGK